MIKSIGSNTGSGTAATIAIGSTTTGAAGTLANVNNSGTSSTAIFNFTIPRGNAGSVWHTGNGAPNSLDGFPVGDFYLDALGGDYYEKTGASVYTYSGNLKGPAGTSGSSSGGSLLNTAFPVTLGVSMSDETSTISGTGTKAKFRSPYAFTITSVRTSLNNVSSSGVTIVNVINDAGNSVFTTKPSISVGSFSSLAIGSTSSIMSVGNANIGDNDLLTFNLDNVGTSSSGLKCWVIGTRNLFSGTSPPAQVTGLAATAVLGLAYGSTPGQINLNWAIPANNGIPITAYVVEGKPNSASSASWANINNTVSSNTLVVSKYDSSNSLVVNTSYDFRVSAINALGTGTASASVTATPITIPSIVTSLTAAPGNGFVTLNWSAPSGVATGGSAITDYVYQYRTGTNAFTAVNHTASSTPGATITGLTNGTSYDFRVYAKNSAGTATSFATVSQTPSATLGGSFTLNSISGNTKFLLGPQGTQSASRVGPAASVQPSVGVYQKVGWQNIGGAPPNGGVSSFIMQQGLIDFSLALVTGTVSTVLLQCDIIENLIYQNNNIGRDFTVELYAYNYGTPDVNDFVSSVSGMTLLATIPISNIVEPATNSLMSLDLAANGTPLKSAITGNLGGNIRMLAITDQYRLNSAPYSGASGSEEWVSFNSFNWTLTINTV